MLIKAAINGGRTKAEHPRVPISPAEIARDVAECLAAGVSVIHVHVRSDAGVESLDPEDVAKTILAVRAAVPSATLGVTTGDWIVPHPERLDVIDRWYVFPDFASVNFIEPGAAELAELLISKGVGVEAGLSEEEAAKIFVKTGLASRCLRVLLEPQEQLVEAARATVAAMEDWLDEHQITLERVEHGTELTTPWPLLKDALSKGYGIRIGFEDTLVLSDGRPAESNAELIIDAQNLRYALACR
jgi:uncharacterized protein (DUF849 family)